MERSSSISADVCSYLTIGLALKNYLKRTPHMLESVHWFQSYGEVFFHVSWCVQWPHHWIGLEKLPQNDPSYAKICPLVQKLWKSLLPCQLICTVTSPLDWPWKTTPKWPLTCWNLSTESKDTVKFISKSAVLYSHSWSDLNIRFAMKNYPKMTPHMSKTKYFPYTFNY